MTNPEIRQATKDYPFLAYCLSTIFMVFVSIYAIQNWPNLWAQAFISFACLVTLLLTVQREFPALNNRKKWPVEIKIVLSILVLGALNICYSENNWQSLKGMGLFLMSGILVFFVTFFLFRSEKNRNFFLILCTLCFFTLIIYGFFEFLQQSENITKRILLFSSNPIPAGSLLILLSFGPLSLLNLHKSGWKRNVLILSLILGVFVTILIGQRGPLLAIFTMLFFWIATNRKGIWFFLLTTFMAAGAVYQFGDQIPAKYKSRMLNKETLQVRLEFFPIALEVLKEKPLFGLGFNSSLSRFIPGDYEPKIFPRNEKYSFYDMVNKLNIFDNMALTFLGETGGLFSVAYIFLIVYLIKNKTSVNRNADERMRCSVLLIVLTGFLAHSMTFDSLKYPHLNWVFHSLLGLLAQREETNQEPQREEGWHV